MDKPFKVGDPVQLKHGGPRMTVIQVDDGLAGNITVHCAWPAKDGSTNRDSFPAEALQVVPASAISFGTYDRT
jgi:uncharacterized protein YodC (DUF2158 family)